MPTGPLSSSVPGRRGPGRPQPAYRLLRTSTEVGAFAGDQARSRNHTLREDVNAVFARFQTMRPLPGTDVSEGGRRELCDVLRRHAGYGGAYYLVSGPSAVRALVTLWSTEEDARLASERTRAASG